MRPVLLATDGSPTAGAATAEAIEVAQRLGAPLVVVTAWELPYTGLGYAPLPASADFVDACEEAAQGIVDAAVGRAREANVTATGLAVRGHPVEAICRTAGKADPGLLVIGAHGWGRMRRALHGSVSTGVLHHARCPVLVVPADRRTAGEKRLATAATSKGAERWSSETS
jgi:nucleotide-binding universal stress UspA family protein